MNSVINIILNKRFTRLAKAHSACAQETTGTSSFPKNRPVIGEPPCIGAEGPLINTPLINTLSERDMPPVGSPSTASGIHRVLGKLRRGTLNATSLLFPSRCCLCANLSSEGYCKRCVPLLPWITHGCKYCGTSLASDMICGDCQKHSPLWREIVVPFSYTDPISSQIQQLKYREQHYLAASMAQMMASEVLRRCKVLPDLLAPVPLHPARYRDRGFNQAAMLARALGEMLNIPVSENLLTKSRNTPNQAQLDVATRMRNLKGVFTVSGNHRGQSIAVIDDVITSGATMKEVCKSLIQVD